MAYIALYLMQWLYSICKLGTYFLPRMPAEVAFAISESSLLRSHPGIVLASRFFLVVPKCLAHAAWRRCKRLGSRNAIGNYLLSLFFHCLRPLFPAHCLNLHKSISPFRNPTAWTFLKLCAVLRSHRLSLCRLLHVFRLHFYFRLTQ
jgi:hypothetical protein